MRILNFLFDLTTRRMNNMYEQYFGFKSTPFAKDIKPEQMFLSEGFKELLKRFEYIKEYRGIMTVAGEPGLGKTSAIRYFMDSLNPQSYFPVYIPLATVGVSDFYKQLNAKLKGEHVHYKSMIFNSIQKQIIDLAVQKNIIPVIVFDEAHLLKEQNIRELQIITNFNRDTIDPAIFILVGQNVLMDKLQKNILHSFYQRIALKYILSTLNKEQTKKYLIHHIQLCQGSEELLSEQAYESIFNLSRGNPKVAGKLAEKCFVLCFKQKKEKVTEEDVLEAAEEVL